jgi:hypothetical protein
VSRTKSRFRRGRLWSPFRWETHFNIGPLQLDADAQALIHEGAAVALGARAVAVLTVLVSRANEYVETSALQIGSPLPPWERSRHETVRLPQGVPPWS